MLRLYHNLFVARLVDQECCASEVDQSILQKNLLIAVQSVANLPTMHKLARDVDRLQKVKHSFVERGLKCAVNVKRLQRLKGFEPVVTHHCQQDQEADCDV
jgi:hypothetical protein